MINSKKGVITHPYGVGFAIGLIAGLIIGIFLTRMVISGSLNIPFIGG